jgi:hypothetical protein
LGFGDIALGPLGFKGLDEGVDPDPQGAHGVALVHFEHQGIFFCLLFEDPDDFVREDGIVPTAETHNLGVL